MKNEPTQLETYNVELEMSKDIIRRQSIFKSNINDPAYNEPIKSLHKDYTKSVRLFVMDLIALFKIGRRRIFKLNY